MLLLCDYYAAVIAVAVVEVRADLVERFAALALLLLDLRPGSTTLRLLGGVMDRSARDFPMPSFLQQITPFRYTVLDWEQARRIPAISYLTWIPSSTTWYRYAAMK